jgi:L-malate glycosyltransferase
LNRHPHDSAHREHGPRPSALDLCLLADAGSAHTRRWAEALAGRGHGVTVLSLRDADLAGVRVIPLSPVRRLGKLGYLAATQQVRSLVRTLRPDVLHAHYATSYGLLGALSRYQPFVVSVWGSDVFEFPRASPLHAAVLRHALRRPSLVASTSQCLEVEARRYTSRPIRITPFGVDMARFRPRRDPDRTADMVIGMVKTLEPKYGVTTLVHAFRLVASRHRHARLLIVGSGSQRNSIQALISSYGLSSRAEVLPAVPHPEVPRLLRRIDIFAMPSYQESFGVAAVEASACGLPVVASRVGGLPEVVVDGKTGILVPPGDTKALAGALDELIASPELRDRLGRAGRAFVEEHYEWEHCVDLMEQVYAEAVA